MRVLPVCCCASTGMSGVDVITYEDANELGIRGWLLRYAWRKHCCNFSYKTLWRECVADRGCLKGWRGVLADETKQSIGVKFDEFLVEWVSLSDTQLYRSWLEQKEGGKGEGWEGGAGGG